MEKSSLCYTIVNSLVTFLQTPKEKERHTEGREAAREGQRDQQEQSEPSPSAQGLASPALPHSGPGQSMLTRAAGSTAITSPEQE